MVFVYLYCTNKHAFQRFISVTSMESCEAGSCMTLIDKWGMWADLTAWHSYTITRQKWDGQRSQFYIFRTVHSEQFCHSCFLWFKIITLAFTTVLVWGLIQEVGRVPWTWTTRQGRQVPFTRYWLFHKI